MLKILYRIPATANIALEMQLAAKQQVPPLRSLRLAPVGMTPQSQETRLMQAEPTGTADA